MLAVTTRPRPSAVAILATALFLAACSDSAGPEDEPQVTTMELTIGATVVSFTGSCTPSQGSVSIPSAGAPLSARFLRANGTPDPLVTAAKYQLVVTPANRFVRSSAFAGTLTGGTPGQAQLSFALLHIEEQHEDFGPCPLTVIVQ
jgi:hypothetical protein